ncbi:NACHT domain-containing protein [Streptomyces sp. NPDC002446]
MTPADDGAHGPDGFDARRVVQVITALRTGARRLGSGYRVSGDAVLTAAHVTCDAESVQLRFLTEGGGVTELPGEQVWADSAADIAVLRIAGGAGAGGAGAAEVPPVRFGRITRPVDCEALGFPRFKLRRDTAAPERDAPTWYRDSHHARGTTTPFADLRTGSLEITVDPPGHDPEPDRSPWEGMSGALVWSGGCVIGVISEQHRAEGLGRLTASQVERWYRLAPTRIRELNELIGLPLHTGELTRLPLPFGPPPSSAPEPDDAPEVRVSAKRLAGEVDAQWRTEEQQRRVHDPFSLAVRFRCTPARELFDHWQNIREAPPEAAPEPLPLDGRLQQIAEVYGRIPSGRLAVLGAAGSGKTILTLRFVLDRLAARAPADTVPVVFGLGAWNPATTSLRDWMCSQLVRDYPFLDAPAEHGGNLAGLLVDARKILPVLDGFDELAHGLHGAALRALDRSAMPLLLTSRPEEYRQAVADTDVLRAAAVIELEGLTVGDYAGYLHRSSRPVAADGSTVWGPVLARLREQPRSPGAVHLAEALTTPLMVALARTAYSDAPERKPEDLLEFASPEDVRGHLLAAFVPAVYDPAPTSHRPRWHPERAERWLGYLAAHLDQLGTPHLAWWELGTTMRRSSRMLVVGFLAALAFGLTTGIGNLPVDLVATAHGLRFALVRGLLVGLLHGLVVGLVFGLGYGFVSRGAPVEPSRVRIQLFGGSRERQAGFVPRFLLGLAFGVPAALVLVLVDRCVVGPLGFDDGLSGGLMGAILFPLEVGIGAGLVLGIMAWAESPIDLTSAKSASDLLSTNRRNVVFHMLVWMLVLGIPAGFAYGLKAGPVYGVLAGLVFGLEAAFGGGLGYGLSFTAWGQWVALSRIWLPLTGRLPWALVAFLEDAHRRGVLRQAGAVYQFRHARLQAHLTQVFQAHRTSHPSSAPGAADRNRP